MNKSESDNIIKIAIDINRLLNEGIEIHPNSPIHEKLIKSLITKPIIKRTIKK